MSDSSSGTIDGVSYASSKNVYDTLGYGTVTQTLYYDQSGNQVADQYVFFDLGAASAHFGIGPKTANSDGTFSVKLTDTGGSGIPQGYSVDTFTSGGVIVRQDNYTPVYIVSASGFFEGTDGYTDSVVQYAATGTGSSGTINGKSYDMVETKYDTSGVAYEKDYLNDLNDKPTLVAKQALVAPDPVFTLPAAATASAGAAVPLPGVTVSDDWAGVNAGTLAQIQADLESLSYTGQAGTAHVSLQVYDQAGVRATGQETITVGAAPGSASAPDPILTGVTQTSVTAGTPFSFNGVAFTDAWAGNHVGSLALTVTTSSGTLIEVNGNAIVSNNAVHATGNMSQIETDLASLVLNTGQAGTASVRIAIYDQAGDEAVHVVGVTVHA